MIHPSNTIDHIHIHINLLKRQGRPPRPEVRPARVQGRQGLGQARSRKNSDHAGVSQATVRLRPAAKRPKMVVASPLGQA